MAETNSLLNCRTRKGTGGSNPPFSASGMNIEFIPLLVKRIDQKSTKKKYQSMEPQTKAACGFFYIKIPPSLSLMGAGNVMEGSNTSAHFLSLRTHATIYFDIWTDLI